MDKVFDEKAIAKCVIDLQELDGKQLVMKVVKDSGWITVAGYDGDMTYIILQEREHARNSDPTE